MGLPRAEPGAAAAAGHVHGESLPSSTGRVGEDLRIAQWMSGMTTKVVTILEQILLVGGRALLSSLQAAQGLLG